MISALIALWTAIIISHKISIDVRVTGVTFIDVFPSACLRSHLFFCNEFLHLNYNVSVSFTFLKFTMLYSWDLVCLINCVLKIYIYILT